MEVKLRPINFETLIDFEMLNKWYMDDEIRHLFTVNFNKGPTMPENPKDLRDLKKENLTQHGFMVEVDGHIVGDASVDTDFGMLMGSAENTGWLSICIGEKDYRGKGLGYEVMKQLEAICASMGLTRLELGVFAYNEAAVHFYKKLGYKQFHRVEKFTYYKGGWHDDYRMEKYI